MSADPSPGWESGASPYGSQPTTPDERTWALFAHLSGLIAAFFFLGFVGPLIVLLVQGSRSPFVRRHSVEALNFQLTLLLLSILAAIVVTLTLGLALLVVAPIGLVVAVAALAFIIVAMVKANHGEDYRYPLSWRVVS
jgi:uncharacterized protein